MRGSIEAVELFAHDSHCTRNLQMPCQTTTGETKQLRLYKVSSIAGERADGFASYNGESEEPFATWLEKLMWLSSLFASQDLPRISCVVRNVGKSLPVRAGLRELFLEGNRLTSLPESFSQLANLEFLGLLAVQWWQRAVPWFFCTCDRD